MVAGQVCDLFVAEELSYELYPVEGKAREATAGYELMPANYEPNSEPGLAV